MKAEGFEGMKAEGRRMKRARNPHSSFILPPSAFRMPSSFLTNEVSTLVPRRIAQLGRLIFPQGLWEGPADRRWVALTFDDGPHPGLTPRVLEVLRRTDTPATFFLVGERAQKWPDVARRIQAEGHEVGNHTWSHRPLVVGGCDSPHRQIARTEDVLARLCPGSPRIFRPPFGTIGPGGPRALARHDLLPVYWSVVPADWDPLPGSVVRERVLSEVHPGAVVVLHCGRPWHAGKADGLEDLIQELREQDYELVSISRMLEASGYEVGTR
jgi:peptidoglycan-N-acetylglucosamine deacetylase